MEDRTTSAMFKREEQLRRWEQSATNLEPAEPKLSSRKIQFSLGCVFLAACAASDKDEVLRLLDEKADIDTANVDGLTALHQACIDDNLEMVEFLVANGADVNRGDNEGWTPLHATASCGFVSIAKYLIEHGADVAAVNNDGELPLDIADSPAMEDLLQEIIDQNGIDCEEARNREERLMLEDVRSWLHGGSDLLMKPHPKTGATGLHVAAAKGYIKVLNLLLQDTDIDVQDLDGWTPLHAAAHWGQREAAQLLTEHFCDMTIKNLVGQTAMDVADNQMQEALEALRVKQAAAQKDRPPPNNVISSPKRRSSLTEKSGLINKESPSDRQILAEPTKPSLIDDSSEKEDISSTTEDSQIEKRNRVNREDKLEENRKSSDGDAQTKNSPEDEGGWRRPAPIRQRGDNKSLTLHVGDPKKNANIPSDVVLRRTHSFEADQTFFRRYMELHARIANSCDALNGGAAPSVKPLPHRLPLRSASLRERDGLRRGAREDGKTESVRSPGSWPSPISTPTTTTTTGRTIDSPPTQATIRSPAKANTVPPSPVVSTPSPALTTPTTPTTPGGTRLSPGNIFKNFFKSFVPPVRDEESETQRKAHAKRVRETRRSTQGVTLDDVKSAEQLVKKKNQSPTSPTNPAEQSLPTSVSATITSSTAPSTVGSNSENGHERRPSWRLRVDSNCKFLLEDARNKTSPADLPPTRPRSLPTSMTPTPEPLSPPPEATVTLPRPKPEEALTDGHASTQSTQAVIQRRRKPKRRSTGVVHVDMDEIDPDRQESRGDDETEGRIQNNGQSEEKSRLGSVSSLASSQPEENGEVDYKKLYEAEHAANERLRETLRRTEDELEQVRNAKGTGTSESEKRERRAMERKLSEMEEELKAFAEMKVEYQRLKDENGALIRVISKLSK